jgi:hypothetical protein
MDSRSALVSIPVPKAILLMSRLASSKTAKIWAERIALCERSNAPVALPYPGRRFALPWAISFCPFGAGTSQPYRVGTVPGFSPRHNLHHRRQTTRCTPSRQYHIAQLEQPEQTERGYLGDHGPWFDQPCDLRPPPWTPVSERDPFPISFTASIFFGNPHGYASRLRL